MSQFNDFKVADISLAEWGRKEITIADTICGEVTRAKDKEEERKLTLFLPFGRTHVQPYLMLARARTARATITLNQRNTRKET